MTVISIWRFFCPEISFCVLFVKTWHFLRLLSTCSWRLKTHSLTLKIWFIHGLHLYWGKAGELPKIITGRLCLIDRKFRLQLGRNITLSRRLMVIINISLITYSSKPHCSIGSLPPSAANYKPLELEGSLKNIASLRVKRSLPTCTSSH